MFRQLWQIAVLWLHFSRHADQTDNWPPNPSLQPTQESQRAQIREDGKERQSDRELRSLSFSVYLSFMCSSSFLLCPAAWDISHGCWSISHRWEAFGMSKRPGAQQPNVFFSMNSASTAHSWGDDCRRKEQPVVQIGIPWCSALIDLSKC